MKSIKARHQENIQQLLGQWEHDISVPDYALTVRLEKSDTDIELQLPNPDKEVTLIARPNGFQLSSQYNNQVRRDFVIQYADIKTAELLPSYTVERGRFKLIYVILGLLVFGLLGALLTDGANRIIALLMGVVFGMTLSLTFSKTLRQNLLLTINTETGNCYLLLSIDKRQRDQCLDFFNRFAKDKFTA